MEEKRRHRMDQWTLAEKSIQAAMWEVEKIGADVKLTEAVILLQKAKELVSDFVDAEADTVNPDTKPPKPKP